MYQITIGTLTLTSLPPTEGVSYEGGEREITERTALDGRVIATRPLRATPIRINVSSPQNYAVSDAEASALQALHNSGETFSVSIAGYEPEGEFTNVSFVGRPRFPRIAPGWRGYQFTLYVPQEVNP